MLLSLSVETINTKVVAPSLVNNECDFFSDTSICYTYVRVTFE